jgi:hypothetical protein
LWLKILNPNIDIYLMIHLHPKQMFIQLTFIGTKIFFASNENWHTIHDLCDPNKKFQRCNQITIMNAFTIWTHLQPFSKQIG